MEFTVLDFFLKLFLVVVALIILRYVLAYFDKYLGVVDFKEDFKKVKNDSIAYSIYLGFRIAAMSIVISSII